MANTLIDPLAAANAADVPNVGAPAAPAGDSPGDNPFHGITLPTEVVPPAPAADPQQAQAPAPVNPFSGIQVAPDKQGTATAAGSVDGVQSASVAPPASSAAPNPFSGIKLGTPEAAPPATHLPEEDQQGLGTKIYQNTKAVLLSTVNDLSNAAQLMWKNPGAAQIGSVPMIPMDWDQERANSAMRGMAMGATMAMPPAEALIPALGEGFFAKTLTGKTLALVANGQLAGAGYGSVAPLEDGETRWESIKNNAEALALQVPLMHGAFKLLGWPIGAALKKIGIPQKIADAMHTTGATPEQLTEANKQVEELLQTVKDNGANPAHLPEPVKEELVAMSIHNAVEQPDLNSLDDKTLALNAAENKLPSMEAPRELSDLPEPTPGYGQTRIAQGVYQNPNGTVEVYGYRGVSAVHEHDPNQEYRDYTTRQREATDPGLMNTIYISPNPSFAAGFGRLHFVGAVFEKPLIIDNWHDKLPSQVLESTAGVLNKEYNPPLDQFGEETDGPVMHPKYGNVSYLGHRQPGVIDAARLAGYDGIIVRHGNEAVEMVALKPEKVYSSGAAAQAAADDEAGDHFGNSNESFTPITDQQQLIADKAARAQSGVKDLGTSNLRLEHNATLRAGGGLTPIKAFDGQSDTDRELYHKIISLIEQHGKVNETPDDYVTMYNYNTRYAGTYKIDGRVIEVKPWPDKQGNYFMTDITGKTGLDPTIHPDIKRAALLHDAISKAVPEIDLAKELGPTNQAAAEKLAGLEPQPRGFSQESQIRKLDIHGDAAVNKAAVGQIDNALLDLTAPRELDLERPELSNLGGVKTRLPRDLVSRDLATVEKELLPEQAKQRPALEQNYSSVEKRSANRVQLEPWERELLSRYRDLLNLVKSQAKSEVPTVERYISELLDNAKARSLGEAKLNGDYQEGLINVVPSTQERAPWSPVPDGVAVPQMPSDFAMLARMTMAQRDGIGAVTEVPGFKKADFVEPPKVPPRSQRSLTGGTGPNRTGATNFATVFRIASGGSSALLYGAGVNTQDPKTRKLLMTASGVLGFLALMPTKDGWFNKTEWGEALMKINDVPALLKSTVGNEAEQKFRDASNLMNYWSGTAKMRGMRQAKMFPSTAERELFARALDNPNNLAVWARLTPAQAEFVGQEGIINHQLGQMLKAVGILDDFRENYIRHLYPDETFNAWRSAKGSLNTAGGFTKPRAFENLDQAEAWAKENNLPGPILDGVQLQSKHFLEVGRSLMAAQIIGDMKGMGLLINRGKELPLGWKSPAVNGLEDMVSPAPVALALERLSGARPGVIDSQTFQAIDTVKSWMMRSVMAFPWIHGINVVRGALALDGTGIAYTRAYQALQAADPSVARALHAGVRLFDRPDFAEKHSQGFTAILDKLGDMTGPTIGNASFNPAAAALKAGEHALWDKWVPSLGLGAFNQQMYNWTERTGGQFAEGTPEFKAAARAAADFANTVMGKSLDTMKEPALQGLMRNIFFAPQWMASRIRISTGALGELRGLATGTLATADVKYLPYKVRSLLIGAAFTYVASRLWGGKDPIFNPNNNKFYIRTGVYDQNKREVGVDVAGWWADDIKMYGDPAKYFMNRLSPMLQVGITGIRGRDAFGRSIGGLELADEVANELGPIGSMVDAGTRAINHRGQVSGADAIKGVLGSTDIGNSASIPRPSDLILQGLAYRILRQQGLPQDDDRVYQLQQILSSNARQGKPVVDGAVITWLAYQRRSYVRQYPTPAGTRYLWRGAQHVLRDMVR